MTARFAFDRVACLRGDRLLAAMRTALGGQSLIESRSV